MNITVDITNEEKDALKQILYAELHKYRDRQMHAGSHGQTFEVPAMDAVQTFIDKMERLPYLGN